VIERQFDANAVNRIVNHPSVYPWICGPLEGHQLDLTGPIGDGTYIALFGEYGGFLFFKVSEGIYDAHSAVLPEGRGKWAFNAAHEALRLMFAGGALEIMMAAPKGNLPVRALIRSLKAKHRGKIEGGWTIKGQPVDSDIYSLTKMDYEKCQSQPR
jgi:hypothetical protein